MPEDREPEDDDYSQEKKESIVMENSVNYKKNNNADDNQNNSHASDRIPDRNNISIDDIEILTVEDLWKEKEDNSDGKQNSEEEDARETDDMPDSAEDTGEETDARVTETGDKQTYERPGENAEDFGEGVTENAEREVTEDKNHVIKDKITEETTEDAKVAAAEGGPEETDDAKTDENVTKKENHSDKKSEINESAVEETSTEEPLSKETQSTEAEELYKKDKENTEQNSPKIKPEKELVNNILDSDKHGESSFRNRICNIAMFSSYLIILSLIFLIMLPGNILEKNYLLIATGLTVPIGAVVVILRYTKIPDDIHRKKGFYVSMSGSLLTAISYITILYGYGNISTVESIFLSGIGITFSGLIPMHKNDNRILWIFSMIYSSVPFLYFIIPNTYSMNPYAINNTMLLIYVGSSLLIISLILFTYEQVVTLRKEAFERKIKGLLKNGIDRIKNEDYDNAERFIDTLLEKSPNNAMGWLQKGLIEKHRGNTSDALKHFDKAIELNANFAEAWKNRGLICIDTGDYEEAERCLLRTISLFPGDNEALYNLSLAYYHTGKTLPAIQVAKKILEEYDKKDKLYLIIGKCYLAMRNDEKAANYLQLAIEENPKLEEALINLSEIYIKHKKLKRALKITMDSLKLDPERWESWRQLGDIYAIAKKYNKAVKYYKKSVEINPSDINLWMKLKKIYYSHDMHDEALSAIDGMINIYMKNISGYSTRSKIYKVGLKNYEMSAKMLKEGIDKGLITQDVLEKEADEFYLQGYFKEALPYYEKLVELNPKSDFFWEKRNKCEESYEKERIRKSVEKKNYSEEWTNRGRCLRMLERYEEAMMCIRHSLKLDKNNFNGWNEMGIIYRKTGDMEKAKSCHVKAARIKVRLENIRKSVKKGVAPGVVEGESISRRAR